MMRHFLLASFLLGFLIFSLNSNAARGEPGHGELRDLAYAQVADNTLLFTATYLGRPVHLVRTITHGNGSWSVFGGTVAQRIRLTIDDRDGLNEIAAVDTGERITVQRVGNERIEYRLYSPDRRWITGSVLFRDGTRWRQGLMTSAAFQGYGALVDVVDVTPEVMQAVVSKFDVTAVLARSWKQFEVLPVAHAQVDDLIHRFFSDRSAGAREFYPSPMQEMLNASLVGAAAFTGRLVAQAAAHGELASAAGVIAATTPFVASVAAVVVVAVAAQHVTDWANSPALRSTASARELYQRLTAQAAYSAPSQLGAPPAIDHSSEPLPVRGAGSAGDILRYEEQARQKKDQLDFVKELKAVDRCIGSRDFTCAEQHLKTAGGLQSGYLDINTLDDAYRRLREAKAPRSPGSPAPVVASPRPGEKQDGFTDHLGTARSEREACQRAQEKAQADSGTAQACRCEVRGEMHFCRSASGG
ncbi:hypothetical protein Q4S45_08275 [Massilia sp. R2A-15]|uniref:hypothetical protein n=1 Tax=Massilia sp. R2A-15 TaxID=3064278 RepID=UPI00273506DB|nr:hypothetical protein [Massilia sp. R2A-15]WLI91101.1 hypothetical protein Q4S45_08275 [Massilia sp. R2A-15]